MKINLKPKKDNEEDFLNYLDQIDEIDDNDNIKINNTTNDNKINSNEILNGFDEDLCDGLITYDTKLQSKFNQEKKILSCRIFFLKKLKF